MTIIILTISMTNNVFQRIVASKLQNTEVDPLCPLPFDDGFATNDPTYLSIFLQNIPIRGSQDSEDLPDKPQMSQCSRNPKTSTQENSFSQNSINDI